MHHQRGFSLLELLCVLAILSILAHAGSAQFFSANQKTRDKNTLKSEMKRLAAALTQARQLAVISGQSSYLCGGVDCDGHWSDGFKLYQMASTNGVEKIYRQILFDHSLAVSWRGFPIKKQQIEFQSNGLSSYQNGTFEFCLGAWQADVVLNQSGRFYLTDPQSAMNGGVCG